MRNKTQKSPYFLSKITLPIEALGVSKARTERTPAARSSRFQHPRRASVGHSQEGPHQNLGETPSGHKPNQNISSQPLNRQVQRNQKLGLVGPLPVLPHAGSGALLRNQC